MKKNKFLQRIVILLLVINLTACHNLFKDKKDEPEIIYLVNYEMVRSYPLVVVKGLFDEVVGNNPELSVIGDRVSYGVVIYRITYKTTFEGEQIIASGLVSVPIGAEPFPLISYQNGTNVLHSNAPSVNPDIVFYQLLQSVSATGFVVSMPDYLGFGSSNHIFHPYLHKNSTAPVVIDMLRAVEELGELRGFNLNNDLYLSGYSKGGWATLLVQKEIENKYANEFNLKASAPSAGPYDLIAVNEFITSGATYPMPYFIGFLYNSYLQHGETTTPAGEIFNAPYDSLITVLFDGSTPGEEINKLLTTDISELFTENYLLNMESDPTFISFLEALENNSIEAWNLTTPTHLVHSTGDNYIPFQISQKIHQDFIDLGVGNRVELIPLPGYSHPDGIIPAGLYSVKWFLEITGK
jgi:hypothetical protein